MISNWKDSPFDLRRRQPAVAGDLTEIVISEQVAATLRDLRLLDTDCERLVFTIHAHNNGAIPAATDEDHEELTGFVAAEANHEPNRRRQQRLDVAFDTLNTAAQTPPRQMTRWRCRSSTLHKCSDGTPRGSPSTSTTKSASSANSPPDTSQSSSGALPGARTPGRNGPASRSPVCATPSPTSHGPCTGEIAIFASTATTDSLLHNESKTSSPKSTETPPASSGNNPKRPPSGPGQARRAITKWGHLPPSQWSQFGLTLPLVGLTNVIHAALDSAGSPHSDHRGDADMFG